MATKTTKKSRKRVAPTEKHFDSKEGTFCVHEIDRTKSNTTYFVRGSQAKHLDKITLKGFEGIPAGLSLYKDGYGFGKKGVFLLSMLNTHVCKGKKLELIIPSKGKRNIKIGTVKTIVTIPFADMKTILSRLGKVNEENNDALRETVASFLTSIFPKTLKISSEDFSLYKGGEVADVLRKKEVAKKLSMEDIESLRVFLPQVFNFSTQRKSLRQQGVLGLLQVSQNASQKIYLDKIIKEFETLIAKKSVREQTWQEFLRDKVFPYLSNYVDTIEKENVAVDIAYPDFVLVDVYNYLDVFEIKRHDTKLLDYDDNHENHYWRPEISSAIAQIENYIDDIAHASDDYVRKIKRKKNLNIKVLRPRGYIVAGTSKQFKSTEAENDFRRLSRSLRQVDFILYDELLARLKHLRKKLDTLIK